MPFIDGEFRPSCERCLRHGYLHEADRLHQYRYEDVFTSVIGLHVPESWTSFAPFERRLYERPTRVLNEWVWWSVLGLFCLGYLTLLVRS